MTRTRSTGQIRYSEHQVGQGPAFHRHACKLGLEGIVSKRLDAPYRWVMRTANKRPERPNAGSLEPQGVDDAV
jgi:bifunctional non-homologous end joining protein LigD